MMKLKVIAQYSFILIKFVAMTIMFENTYIEKIIQLKNKEHQKFSKNEKKEVLEQAKKCKNLKRWNAG